MGQEEYGCQQVLSMGVNKALLESAKKDARIGLDKKVKLTATEAQILDLSETEPVTIWAILGKLPRFFL